jgi:hypothetical protein
MSKRGSKRSSAINESPYIKRIKSKRPEPDPQYVHELDVLRAMVRQEDRQGMSVGEGPGPKNVTNT